MVLVEQFPLVKRLILTKNSKRTAVAKRQRSSQSSVPLHACMYHTLIKDNVKDK